MGIRCTIVVHCVTCIGETLQATGKNQHLKKCASALKREAIAPLKRINEAKTKRKAVIVSTLTVSSSRAPAPCLRDVNMQTSSHQNACTGTSPEKNGTQCLYAQVLIKSSAHQVKCSTSQVLALSACTGHKLCFCRKKRATLTYRCSKSEREQRTPRCHSRNSSWLRLQAWAARQ